MKKIILMIVIVLSVLTLSACVNTSNNNEISELKERINSLEHSLIGNQNALDEAQNALDEAQNALDEAQNALDETQNALNETQNTLDEAQNALNETQGALDKASSDLEEYQLLEQTLILELQEALSQVNQTQELIDRLYDQLFELTGVDQRLLYVIQKQKEYIINIGIKEEVIVNSSTSSFTGGTGIFGQTLSGPKFHPLSQVSPFQYDEEWQDIQVRYYQMLEEIVQQGYGEGEIVSINEFTFQEPLSYYGIDIILNQECLLEINLDGNETLFSRVLTYNDITLETAKIVRSKTISSKFVNEKLELILLRQEFDENENMCTFYLEDFKEDVGLVNVRFGYETTFVVSYYVGFNIREDLNTIFLIDYAYGGVIKSERYELTYIDNDTVIDSITIINSLTNTIGKYNSSQSYLLNDKLSKANVDEILRYYRTISYKDFLPPGIVVEDIYDIGEAYMLGLNLNTLDPLMDLYGKLLKVDNYLKFTGELNSIQKIEFDSLVQELDNYEYKGVFYDFISYDEEAEIYSLVDALDSLPLSIVNNEGWWIIYNSYLKYKDLIILENKSLGQHIKIFNLVSNLRPIYEYGNLDIYMPLYGETIILSDNIPVMYMYNVDVTEYNDDLIYLMSNHSMFLNIFAPYYNSSPETIRDLLEPGLFYDPLDTQE